MIGPNGASQSEDVACAAAWLRSGGLVIFPTETFYGLAVDPTSDAAVRALFDLKGRDVRVAVPLIASSLDALVAVAGPLDPASARLAELFWPGPLSLILPAPARVSRLVHGGAETIAVRVPSQAMARDLAAASGGLITSTSANRSGQPPATTVAEAGDLVDDPRVYALDGGTTPGGAPSTIVDARRASLGVDARRASLGVDARRASLRPDSRRTSLDDLHVRGGDPVLIREGAIAWNRVLESLKR